jgi:curli biogenesis system outer membrane secretion channel CsgG
VEALTKEKKEKENVLINLELVNMKNASLLNSKELKGKTNVATLTLGSGPRQGLAKVRTKNEARESHFMLSKV